GYCPLSTSPARRRTRACKLSSQSWPVSPARLAKKKTAAARGSRPFWGLWRTLGYFFSSPSFFSDFGLHFSQTLPAFLASMQHSWLHSLPTFVAVSQQLSANIGPAIRARANALTMRYLIGFITILCCLASAGPSQARDPSRVSANGKLPKLKPFALAVE